MRTPSRWTRTAAAGAVLVAVAALGACSDDDSKKDDEKSSSGGADVSLDAPEDASNEDFCAAFTATFEPLAGVDEPTEEQFEAFQDAVEEFGEVGTPEGISDEQREGYETFVDAIDEVDFEEIEGLGDDDDFPGIDEEEQDAVEAFFVYASQACVAAQDPGTSPTE